MSIFRSRVIFFLVALGVFAAYQVSASLDDITYPVDELGHCPTQEECFAYCSLLENHDACINYAEANDLLEEEEIEAYRTAEEALAQNGGPGGCTNQVSCEEYCSEVTHMEECLNFARVNGLMSEEELAQASQVLTALESGLSLPGGCTSQEACDAYCGDVEHMEECLAFASAAGMMSEEEFEQAQAMMQIMEAGETPGRCTSQDSCDAYCADEANRQECLEFAVSAGMMTQEDADQALERASMGNPEEFVGPGGCDSEESCSVYCADESNREACESFFGDSGESPEGSQYEGSEDLRDWFVGPGGCVGEEACMAYCSDPVNMQTCASFFGSAQDEGDRSETDADQEEGEFNSGTEAEYETRNPNGEYENENEYDYNDDDEGDYDDDYDYDGEYEEGLKDRGFEDIDPDDMELDLGGASGGDDSGDSSDDSEVTPDSGSSWEHSGDSGSESSGESSGEPDGSVDASFMKSVKQFFSDVAAKARNILIL